MASIAACKAILLGHLAPLAHEVRAGALQYFARSATFHPYVNDRTWGRMWGGQLRRVGVREPRSEAMRDLCVEKFIVDWRDTGGSELANTQSFINGLCSIVGVAPPNGSRSADALNDYVFERGVFQDNGDGTTSFGRIDVYKRDAFVLEAKQGSDQDRAAEAEGRLDLDLFGQTAAQRVKRGTARRGTPSWAKAMLQAKGQAERYAKCFAP